MKDLLRSYKLILKRRTSVDSDESQPLVSSDSSTSFGAFQDQCMFPDSESTDCDAENPAKTANQAQNPAPKYFLRRPFCHPCNLENQTVDIFTTNDNVYDRYQYYSKIPGIHDDNSFLGSKLLSYETREPLRTHNSLVTIFAIWNTIMGTSLLAMAWGLQKSGLVPGIILHVFIAGVCLYTAHLILRISNNYGSTGRVNEVPDLCSLLLGRWAEVISKIFSLIVLLGSNIVYWILMSNFLYNSVHFLYGYAFYADELQGNETVICPSNRNVSEFVVLQNLMAGTRFDQIWNLYTTVPIFLAILMFPLLNFKSPTFFTKFNSLGCLSVIYVLIFVLVKSSGWGVNVPDWRFELNLKGSFCALSGMLSLSYFIHNIIISVMRCNRHQEKNDRDLCVAYGLVLFTYLFIGVLFYACFPLAKSCIEDNILNNFPKYDPMAMVARLLLLFQLLTVYPLIAYMLRINVFTYFRKMFNAKGTEFSCVKVVAVNLALVTVCVLFACFLPRIGTLIRYTGALSGLIYVFTLPSLLEMASLKTEKALTPSRCALHVAIILTGILNFCSQFFISDE